MILSGVELAALMFWISPEFREARPELSPIAERALGRPARILEFASRNKLASTFCVNVLEFQRGRTTESMRRVADLGIAARRRVQMTAGFVDDVLRSAGVPYLLIKTYKAIDYDTLDVDLLVRSEDYEDVLRAFVSHGGELKSGSPFHDLLIRLGFGAPDVAFRGLVSIDVYRAIPFPELPVLREKTIWTRTRSAMLGGRSFPVPNLEADLLILVATSLFSDGRFGLVDVLYVRRLLAEGVDLAAAEVEARESRWIRPLRQVLGCLRHEATKVDALPRVAAFDLPLVLPGRLVHTSWPRPFLAASHRRTGRATLDLAGVLFKIGFGRMWIELNERFVDDYDRMGFGIARAE